MELVFVKKALVLLLVNFLIQLFLLFRAFVIRIAIIRATVLLILAIACLGTLEIPASLLIVKVTVAGKKLEESATMKRASACVLKGMEGIIVSFIVLAAVELIKFVLEMEFVNVLIVSTMTVTITAL
jgi:hypothetical protein